jgi:hypothetical protein
LPLVLAGSLLVNLSAQFISVNAADIQSGVFATSDEASWLSTAYTMTGFAIIATVCSSVSVKHTVHKRNVLAVQYNAIARCDSRYRDALLDELTALHNAAKEKRRQELRTELGSLTDRPLKAKPAKVKVKYRGPNGETGSGVGAMAGWLKKLNDGGEDVERYRVPI